VLFAFFPPPAAAAAAPLWTTSGNLRFVPTDESNDEKDGRWCRGEDEADMVEMVDMGRWWMTEARRVVVVWDGGLVVRAAAGEPAEEDSSAMGEMEPSLSRVAVPEGKERRLLVAVLPER
jgi:hypothetical protein